MKTLVAYFSRSGENYVNGEIVELSVGNTALAAKEIAAQMGGDLYEIRPLNPYSENYRACGKAAFAELKANARPALADPLPELSAYDTVCLGYPNWCGTMPMAVWTFLESGDFAGKRILPFCTHEGSGMGSSEADLRGLCPGAVLGRGLALRGAAAGSAQAEIREWLEAEAGHEAK